MQTTIAQPTTSNLHLFKQNICGFARSMDALSLPTKNGLKLNPQEINSQKQTYI
jgi:hypothetical protein